MKYHNYVISYKIEQLDSICIFLEYFCIFSEDQLHTQEFFLYTFLPPLKLFKILHLMK